MAIKLSTFDVNEVLKWRDIEREITSQPSKTPPPLGTANPNDKPDIIKLSKEAPDIIPDLDLVPKTSMESKDITQDTLINTHLDRLGFNTDDAKGRLDILANTISEIESNSNPKAVNIPQKDKEQTSAKGMFQYVDGSINPAINRVEKYTGEVEWLKDLKEGKIDIRDLTPEQQTTLFFGDILEKTIGGKSGYGDKLFKQLLDPNSTPEQIKDAIRKLYYEGHHTAPDEATKKRVENILNKLEL